ncbi:integrase, partial [Escherichia coli]
MTAGEQIVPASELAAAIRQIKERQRLLGTKRWKMNSLKKPLNMDVQKVDNAHALVAGVMHWAVTTGGFNSETAQDVMPGAVERRFGN